MSNTICGADCSECLMKDQCPGCVPTGGKPLGGDCLRATCCHAKGLERCADCASNCEYKARLIDEFNALGLKDLPKVTQLYELSAAYVNLEYPLPNGTRVRFWPDDAIVLGAQLEKPGSERCYGLVADDSMLMVCEYGENGTDPKLLLFKARGC